MPILTTTEKTSYDTIVTEGVRNISSEIDAKDSTITNVLDPSSPSDVSTKGYTDNAASPSCSLTQGGVITENTTTSVDISAGSGRIVTIDGLGKANITEVTWTEKINVAVTDILTTESTRFYIDVSGNVVQVEAPLDTGTVRLNITLGFIVHPAGTILNIINDGLKNETLYSQFIDHLEVLGVTRKSGLAITPDTGLQLSKTSGDLESPGAGVGSGNVGQNIISINAASPAPFTRLLASTATIESLGATVIDPGFYDDGSGTKVAIPQPNNASIVYVYQAVGLPTAGLVITYGQTVYANLAAAELNKDTDVMTLPNDVKNRTNLVARIAVKSNATDLSDINEAVFFAGVKFGTSLSGSSLASNAGGGDVSGPASSVTNEIATYADATGKVIKATSDITVDAGTLTRNTAAQDLNLITNGGGKVLVNNSEALRQADVIDNLTSTETEKPSSANQVRILNTKFESFRSSIGIPVDDFIVSFVPTPFFTTVDSNGLCSEIIDGVRGDILSQTDISLQPKLNLNTKTNRYYLLFDEDRMFLDNFSAADMGGATGKTSSFVLIANTKDEKSQAQFNWVEGVPGNYDISRRYSAQIAFAAGTIYIDNASTVNGRLQVNGVPDLTGNIDVYVYVRDDSIATLYRNGVVIGTVNNLTSAFNPSDIGRMMIGDGNNLGLFSNMDFYGLVLYNRSLTESEVYELSIFGETFVSGEDNVSGPDVSVDDSLASFNGTTGKAIKDSGLVSSTVLFNAGASIDCQDVRVANVADPISQTDSATKDYVDNAIPITLIASTKTVISSTVNSGFQWNFGTSATSDVNTGIVMPTACRLLYLTVNCDLQLGTFDVIVYVNGVDAGRFVRKVEGTREGFSNLTGSPLIIPAQATINFKTDFSSSASTTARILAFFAMSV